MITDHTPAERLLARIENREAHLAVIGLGYVGLPLALEMVKAGFKVTGIDLDPAKIERINRGESYVGDISSDDLAGAVKSGKFSATTDFAALASVDALSICVPTPLGKTKDPDISYIVAAADQVAKYLRPGLLVVLESTTYPGTTTEIILPRLSASGLTAGDGFFLAFSPERVDPGNPKYHTHNTPKIVGGHTERCRILATRLYEQFIQTVIPVSSTEAAEMVKLLENTFRSVNIGLVNEVAIMCDKLGLDTWEVIDAAATKPFGFMAFYPGPGLGGHCIPIDPLYLSWKLKTLDYHARFIELASEINSHMPNFVVTRLQDHLNDRTKCVRSSRILILGVAYKRDVDDVRESPALDVIRLLGRRGAKVSFHDPHVAMLSSEGEVLTSVPLDESSLTGCDAAVILTDHSSIDYGRVVELAPLVFDTRNATRRVTSGREKIVKL